MNAPRVPRSVHGWRTQAVVAVAAALANVCGYLLSVVLARGLPTAAFGAATALLAMFLVMSVPGMAVQNALARRVAHDLAMGLAPPEVWRRARRSAISLAAPVALVAAASAPIVTRLAKVPGPEATVGFALSAAAITMLAAAQGLLQGSSRFPALAVVMGAAGVGRLLGSLPGATVDVQAFMLGHGTGLVAAVGVAALVIRRATPRERTEDLLPQAPAQMWSHLRLALAGLGGLFLFANLDIVLARHLLTPVAAGHYGAGTLVAKVSFWLPQFIAIVAFPAFADPRLRTSAIRRAVTVTAASTTVLSGGCLLVGNPVVQTVLGPKYDGLGLAIGLFALVGGLFALLNVLLFAGLAVGSKTAVVVTWVALALFVSLAMSLPIDSLAELVTLLMGCVLPAVLVGLSGERRHLMPGRVGA